jgi:hypothetical protein
LFRHLEGRIDDLAARTVLAGIGNTPSTVSTNFRTD